MKLLMLVLISSCLVACGKSSGGGATASNPSNPANPTPTPVPNHVYRMDITGDNTNFSASMTVNLGDADVTAFASGAVTINPAQTVQYTLVGRNLKNIQINRNSAGGSGLVAKIYRDNVLVQTSPTLNSAGTFHTFTNID